jgi:uncharacterized protein
MPVIQESTYSAPTLLSNGKVHTIVSSLFRRVRGVGYFRERISTNDGDFLDLDWSKIPDEKNSSTKTKKLAILSHGLEGSSQGSYMKGMTRALNRSGWDVLCWNYRGCSGEPNLTARLYHSGDSEDLSTVVEYVRSSGIYKKISLVGFSLGGNVVLKYLGEKGDAIASEIEGSVCFSVGCDLESSARILAKPENRPFMQLFMKSLREKIQQKLDLFPHHFTDRLFKLNHLPKINCFLELDELYTAPMHGYTSAKQYWDNCSAKKFLSGIKVPTLLVNAVDDPMLGEESYPIEEAKKSQFLYFEMPKHGGHLGFSRLNSIYLSLKPLSWFGGIELKKLYVPSIYFSELFWSEARTVEFLDSLSSEA